MINLIPPEGHKAARREYYARVIGSIGFLFAGIFICLSVGMIPMYVLISAQISGLEVNLESKDAGMTLQQAKDEVKVIKSILTQLQTTDQQVFASTIIAEIDKATPAEVKVEGIFIDSAKEGIKIQVKGTAVTRGDLTKYKTTLEETELFTKAEIPISDLVKDSDLPFALTLTVAKK